MDETQTTKLVASLVLFIITLLAGYLPVLAVTWAASRRRRRSANINHDNSMKQINANENYQSADKSTFNTSKHHNVFLKSLVPTPDSVPNPSTSVSSVPSINATFRNQQPAAAAADNSGSQSNLLPSSSSSSATSILLSSSSNNNSLINQNGGGGDLHQKTTIIEVKSSTNQQAGNRNVVIKDHQDETNDHDYERSILNSKWVQASMYFGGGVLMATAFCHLIPETHDSFKAYLLGSATSHHHHPQNNHSLALSQSNETTTTTLLDELTSPSTPIVTNTTTNDLLPSDSNLLQSTVPTDDSLHDDGHDHHEHDNQIFTSQINQNQTTTNQTNSNSHSHSHGTDLPYIEISVCCGFFFIYIVEQLMVKFLDNHSHSPPDEKPLQQQSLPPPQPQTAVNSEKDSTVAALATADADNNRSGQLDRNHYVSLDHSSSECSINSRQASASKANNELFKFLRGLIIVSAFSAHAIFDGVAIGSQTTIDQVWTIFIAIACHKLVIAAVVGLELYNATLQSKLWTIVHMTTFSSMSPIGILIVVIAQNSFEINVNHPIMILLQAFATGTIIYIVFVEILQPKGHDPHKHGFLKSFSLVLGFLFMLIVLTQLHEDHA